MVHPIHAKLGRIIEEHLKSNIILLAVMYNSSDLHFQTDEFHMQMKSVKNRLMTSHISARTCRIVPEHCLFSTYGMIFVVLKNKVNQSIFTLFTSNVTLSQ